MKYRILGKTGLKVSVVGIGTWQLGGEWGKSFEQAEADAIVAKGAELGINLVDTAECYGDHLSERLVGEAIKGDRDKWVLATKFGHKFHRPFERDFVYDPQEVEKQLDASLKALQTDYVDLYQFHSGTDEMFDTEGLWEMLNRQIEKGKVRHLGISVSSKYDGTHQIEDAPKVNAGAIQLVYNRLKRKPEQYLLKRCMELNFGVLARVPLASGFLTGKYDKSSTFGDNDVRGAWITDEDRIAMLDEAEEVRSEVPDGVAMAQWALAWCLKHPAVTCVIPGCKSPEQVASNAAAAELDMVSTAHPQAAD